MQYLPEMVIMNPDDSGAVWLAKAQNLAQRESGILESMYGGGRGGEMDRSTKHWALTQDTTAHFLFPDFFFVPIVP